MSGKKTGLAAFTRNQNVEQKRGPPDTSMSSERKRGKGEVVSLTVRIHRADWERLHQLAVSEGTSIQQLAVRGFSKVFAEKGLPGIDY